MSKRSEWKQRGLDRRDFRSSKDAPEVPQHRKKGGTGKKVCKKNRGGPHEFTEKVDRGSYGWDACRFCGKQGKLWFRRMR